MICKTTKNICEKNINLITREYNEKLRFVTYSVSKKM